MLQRFLLLYILLVLRFLLFYANSDFKDLTMGNSSNSSNLSSFSSSLPDLSKKTRKPLPIETVFELPSPRTTWPPGEGFSSGTIDLGGLVVSQVSSFSKVWSAGEGGPENLGATFYEPNPIPDGFFMLGSYGQPNNQPLFGWVLVAKDASSSGEILKTPIDYTLVWSSESLNIKQEGVGYIWLPLAPDGYKAVGHVITSSPAKPPLGKIRCVRADFTDASEIHEWIWSKSDAINIYTSRPQNRGTQALGVSTGAFVAENNNKGSDFTLPCLKNLNCNLSSSMPNLNQINALVQEYSPIIYFHPDEQFLPSSVPWFFQNGAVLYTKGLEGSTPIAMDGSNLPQGGLNDGAYWIDLPTDNAAKDRVKKGDLGNAMAYLHIKPMLGGTFTDLSMWVFYPFNGAAKAKVEFLTISLGKIGEHVGDWEHVTMRISNFNGELKNVYFSQHSRGTWLSSSELEYYFRDKNKFVVYSSLHGHAAYPRTGDFVGGNVGIRNDTAKSKMIMDTGGNYTVVCADYLGNMVEQPPPPSPPSWLNYAREWGPKISYDINDELRKLEKFLPGKLKSAFDKMVRGLPNEVLGEEGPTGPKWKDSWIGDERD